jgi:hypothetical protein
MSHPAIRRRADARHEQLVLFPLADESPQPLRFRRTAKAVRGRGATKRSDQPDRRGGRA